jgi:glycosyltransferase involved in cell wall biosynthesis
VLWIAYDGVLAGPGRSQVVPYLEALARRGGRMRLLTWEKPEPLHSSAHGALRTRLESLGIRWLALPYHRRPTVPATAVDLLRGLASGADLVRGAGLVHARSVLSALVARPLARLAGVPWIFDTRGFWADERVDGGLWPAGGALHRTARSVEEAAIRAADGLVVLTRRAEAILLERGATAPLRVIPTCVDLERFRPDAPPPASTESLRGRRVWLLLGATGTWYLRDAMLDFCRDALAADPGAAVLVLSEEHHDEIRQGLRRRGIEARTTVRSVLHEEVPSWIGLASAAVVFIRPAPSKAASCPTKLGEILACGRPVVVGAGVGDVDELVVARRVGVVVEDPDRDAFSRCRESLEDLLADPGTSDRCRRAAEEELGLERGVDLLLDLYGQVIA